MTFRDSSQLRHALRTPLNQISGYTDLLLEDLPDDGFAELRAGLFVIRDRGREILELLQQELPADRPETTPDELAALQRRIRPLLDSILRCVETIASRSDLKRAKLRPADVEHISSATHDLEQVLAGASGIAPAAPACADVAPIVIATSGSILIVDDNHGNRDLLSRILDRQGFSVFQAEDGAAALATVATRPFDLILLDLMMPGMDGIEVLRRLKADAAACTIPVIMLSALDETTRVIQCLEEGAEDYVLKPFDAVLLQARLRSTLERSRLRAEDKRRATELETAYGRLRENEQRLAESEERLRLATDAAELGILYYYPAGDHVEMNAGCKRLFGFPTDDGPVTFTQVLERIHAEDRERTNAETQRAIKDISEYDIEFRVVWPDGAVHWLSTRGLAQPNELKTEIRLAGVALDITARRQAEEAVRQAQKLESIGLLAGGIAHDFNNLLTGIIGSASFVLDNFSATDPNAEMLRNVINSGERAADLTKQLLAYSGKGKFTVQRLDISQLVDGIAALLRASMSRSITLERHLPQDLPRIEADSTQIQQIVMNLVINGAEAISGEGLVRIETGLAHLDEGGREHFFLNDDLPPGDYVFLEVCDTGSGMDREMLPKIFEPFFSTKFTGRGLGLAAVFGIVRGHDAALEVRSTPGSGSNFRIYFRPAAGEVIRQASSGNSSVSRILFVDDEEVVRLMGKVALERAGFEVLLAHTGEDALKVIQQHRQNITLAVLDITMPGWSGFETLRRVRQISPRTGVVLSSGFSEEEMKSRYPGESFHEVLLKPYSASTLVERVRKQLGYGTS